MALERIGLGGVFTFDSSKGVQGVKQGRDELGRFIKTTKTGPPAFNAFGQAATTAFRKAGAAAKTLGMAAGKLGMTMGGIGIASLPLTAALGAGVAKAANFEQQMDAVGAITRASETDMARLELKAKQMGATTVFSATQSAQAMEFMGRAGFSTQEIIDGLGGVMNAAAADGIDLASAANIVSNTIKGMGLTAKDTTRVADVLALTSAKTNTDMTLLGEGFKFAAAQAKTMGIPLETTSAALGSIADAGIKGTLGGTSFTNMLVKLSKPSQKATSMMRQMGVQLAKNDDGTLNLVETVKRFNTALSTVKDRTKRAAMASELFGVRGQKAFAAMGTALDTIVPETGKSKLDTLVEQLEKADGAAEEMAKRRLSNFKGQIVLLQSAVEGFALETAGQFLGPMTEGVTNFTKKLGGVVQVLQMINSGSFDNEEAVKQYGSTTVEVAKGISDGIKIVIAGFRMVRDTVASVIQKFTGGMGGDAVRSVVKVITVMGLMLAMAAPILVGIGAITFFITTVMVPAFTAIGSVIGLIAGLFSSVFVLPVLAGIALVALAWQTSKEQMLAAFSALMEFAMVIWGTIRDSAVAAFSAFMEHAGPAIGFIRERLGAFFRLAFTHIKNLISMFSQAFKFIKPLVVGTFELIGSVAGWVFKGIALAVGGLIEVAKPLMKIFMDIAKFLIEGVVNNVLLLVKGIVKLADAVNFDVPKGIREFAAQGEFRIGAEVKGGAKVAKDATESRVKMAKAVTDQSAAQKAAAATPPKLEASVNLEDNRCVNIDNKLSVDGREMALASSRHRQEVHERAGFKAKRWQQRFAMEQGAEPIATGGV